ncbi:outer membrane protein [Vibrio sp. RC586]|uniref:OmpA family protein n=1 Tax=Vibrio sp. RC586 TaxID=675815 RepID=UPI0001BB805B|nr:OmpA family protein [Vibrio sp. RC586]EEY99519.1 outer membrane protein [Vibrio sp. RC586]
MVLDFLYRVNQSIGIKMKKCTSTLLILLCPSTVFALSGNDNSIYPHLFIGLSGEYIKTQGSDSSETSALGVNIGNQINRNVAWDVGYQYVYDPYSNKSADTGIFSVAGRYDLFLGQKTSLYFRGGIGYWMMDSYADAIANKESANGISPLGELGVNYRLTPQVYLNMGYKYINGIGRIDTGIFNQHALVSSVTYHFKGKSFESIVTAPLPKKAPELTYEPQKLLAVTLDSSDIHFDFDSSEIILTRSLSKKISQVIKFLFDNPEIKIEVIGHTDSVGSQEYNLVLSKQRATSIAQLIIDGGVSINRINIIGKGEDEPITTNSHAMGRAQNRRVEIKE